MTIEIKSLNINLSEKQILKDISLTIKSSDICALIGPNGAGKSTLLKAIAGFYPTKQIYLLGKPIASYHAKELAKTVSLLPQNIAPVPFTLMEFLLFSRYPYRSLFHDDRKALSVCREMMNLTGIEELENRRLDIVSGGQLELAYLASLLVLEPEILLLDEPTTYLDPYYIEKLSKIIKECSKKKTIIIASHNLEWLSKIATRIVALKSGNINFCDKKIDREAIDKLYAPSAFSKTASKC